jgi:thiol-disulfide isomerase/thioredoxin
MANKLILLLLSLSFYSTLGYSQSKSSLLIKKLELTNNNIFSKENQVIKLTYQSKTRFITKEIVINKLINIGSKINNYQDFSFLDSFSRFYYKADSTKLYYKHSDSANYLFTKFQKPFSIVQWLYPNDLFFFKYIPHVYNTDFFSKDNYSKPKIKKGNNYYIFTQKVKKTEKIRVIYTDSNLIINKIEYIDNDLSNLNEKQSIILSTYVNTDLLSVGSAIKYGPFSARNKNLKKEIIGKEFDYKNNRIILKLLNSDSIEKDTIINKYYIVYFWFIGCKPCHLIRPVLENLNKKINNQKATFLAFNKTDNKDDLLNFIKIKKLKIMELNQNYQPLLNFDIKIFPTILILDNQFKIIKKIEGYSSENIKLFENYLYELRLLK